MQNLYALKDQLSNEIIKFKSCQWQRFLEKLGPHILSTIPFWRRINRFRCKKVSKTIGTLLFEGRQINTDEEKETVFGDKLYNTFSEDTNPRFNEQRRSMINEYFENNTIEREYNDKQTKLFTKRDLKRAIARINSKTSVDVFDISNKILKHVTDTCKERILVLFNRSLLEHDVPNAWRESVIKMIPKKKYRIE